MSAFKRQQAPAGVESRCISAGQFLLRDALTRFQTPHQIGALFFTTTNEHPDPETTKVTKLANAWKKEHDQNNSKSPFMKIALKGHPMEQDDGGDEDAPEDGEDEGEEEVVEERERQKEGKQGDEQRNQRLPSLIPKRSSSATIYVPPWTNSSTST